jgi:pimeloyl-ACP methyl ester carboxylesterase
MDASMWDGLIEALIDDGVAAERIFTLDLLGHGATPRPKRPLHIDDYVRQVRRLFLQEGLTSAHLIGHSLGGVIALATAHAHPDLVVDVGVIGVPYGRNDDQRSQWLDLIMQASATGEDSEGIDSVASVVPLLVARWCSSAEAACAAGVRASVSALDPVTFGLVFRISMTSEEVIAEMAPNIRTPVVVVAGELDAEVDGDGVAELARAIPGGLARTIPGHHHLSIVGAPREYLEVLGL